MIGEVEPWRERAHVADLEPVLDTAASLPFRDIGGDVVQRDAGDRCSARADPLELEIEVAHIRIDGEAVRWAQRQFRLPALEPAVAGVDRRAVDRTQHHATDNGRRRVGEDHLLIVVDESREIEPQHPVEQVGL